MHLLSLIPLPVWSLFGCTLFASFLIGSGRKASR